MTFNTYPHKQKAAVIAFFLSLLLLFLCACESGNGNYQKNLTVNCISNRTDTGFSSRYDLFSGERAYTVKVAEGEMLAVRVSIQTEAGTLDMTIGQSGQEPVYSGHGMESGSFTVYLRASGTYRVLIRAERHRGGYEVAWGEGAVAAQQHQVNK